jgi:hypothetical protein
VTKPAGQYGEIADLQDRLAKLPYSGVAIGIAVRALVEYQHQRDLENIIEGGPPEQLGYLLDAAWDADAIVAWVQCRVSKDKQR